MNHLNIITKNNIRSQTNLRNGEVKFGEKVNVVETIDFENAIKNSESKYILFGIEEDFGVRANFGNPGTNNTWQKFLPFFLNMQHNKFCKANQIFVLGSLNYDEYYKNIDNLEREKLFELVAMVDKDVSHLCYIIKKNGKIPVVIGGGHNNSYGIIKGCALANKKPINVLNIDAHSDFRILEGRHSGNGFSYAYDEKFLAKYFIVGLQENYISKNLMLELKTKKSVINFITLENILFDEQYSFNKLHKFIEEFFFQTTFGLEIDLDCITNQASSAATPSGFCLNDIRKLLVKINQIQQTEYLHIAEGIMTSNPLQNALLGKTISYLITDFVKTKSM